MRFISGFIREIFIFSEQLQFFFSKANKREAEHTNWILNKHTGNDNAVAKNEEQPKD